MEHETAFWQAMAERPKDRALRLAFSDWLLEQGDERGEVIALCERGHLSLTERRRVLRMTAARRRSWLGPLAAVADLERTRFVGGFVDELVFNSACLQSDVDAIVGEPRLATVRRVHVWRRHPLRLGPLLEHSVMRGLEQLELDLPQWQHVPNVRREGFREAVLLSTEVFEDELEPLLKHQWFQSAACLGLRTTDFINSLSAAEVVRQLRVQAAVLSGFEAVRLEASNGAMEGVASWLVAADSWRFPRLLRWSAEHLGVGFSREGEPGSCLHHLGVELPHEALHKGVAIAAGVVVLLGAAKLKSLTVKAPSGFKLNRQEVLVLQAAARRCSTLEKIVVG